MNDKTLRRVEETADALALGLASAVAVCAVTRHYLAVAVLFAVMLPTLAVTLAAQAVRKRRDRDARDAEFLGYAGLSTDERAWLDAQVPQAVDA